jgi:predicted Zn finger-like uncharacterized protein
MKIACQSCQAKYTIADEKVVGKVVKIRCKKCGSTIVVNGQEGAQAAAPPEESTEIRSGGGDAGGAEGEGWTVNVADNDQRTMTTAQVVAEFSNGTITDETYCWRDGMGDWLPLREIEELAAACGLTGGGGPAYGGETIQQPMAPAAESPIAGLFGSTPAAAAPAAARRGGRAGGADLFGAAAEAGGENDVMTSAPVSGHTRPAIVDDGKMTGQRNENSVLFSLNALTATAPKAGPEKMAGAAEGDGSGLIDIRALSSAMTPSGPKKPNHAEDIMNLGGGGAFSAALAAPVLTAPPLDSSDGSPAAAASNKKMMVMFAGLAGLLLVGMVGMYFALKPAAPAVATTAGEGSASPAAAAAAAAPTVTSTAPPSNVPTPAPSTTTPDPAAVAAADPMKPAAPKRGGAGGGGGGGGAREVAVATNPEPPPPPPRPAGGAKSLDQLMQAAAGGGNAPANPGPAAGGGSAPFDRGAASAALGTIADGVGSCKKPGGPTGDGHVSITFSPSGGVVSAIVDQPPFAGTAVGGCVAGKFRGAHVPAFAGGNLTIGKRFSIN